jgi:pimeloyl-ACP methyl ester carboxylesterase
LAALAAVGLTLGVTLVSGAPAIRAVAASPSAPKPSILLVHGAFVDGSTWAGVIARLQADGYTVVASQIPLTSFADDVAAVQRDLRVLGGPTLVVAHSYAGAVITQAAEGAPDVTGLVYLAAAVPDTGETASVPFELAPPVAGDSDLEPIDLPNTGQNGAPFVVIDRDRFAADFCGDCDQVEQQVLKATEAPANASDFDAPITGTPAWRTFPAWYQVSSEDLIINPDAQRTMAARFDPTGQRTITLRSSHASPLSHAEQVARFIERAAQS